MHHVYRRLYMPQVLVNFDMATLQAIERILPATKRRRTEFIRAPVKDAIRKYEYERMMEAYRRQPDTGADADDWSNAERWE